MKWKYSHVVRIKLYSPAEIDGWHNYITYLIWTGRRSEFKKEYIYDMLKSQFYQLTDEQIQKIEIIDYEISDGYIKI